MYWALMGPVRSLRNPDPEASERVFGVITNPIQRPSRRSSSFSSFPFATKRSPISPIAVFRAPTKLAGSSSDRRRRSHGEPPFLLMETENLVRFSDVVAFWCSSPFVFCPLRIGESWGNCRRRCPGGVCIWGNCFVSSIAGLCCGSVCVVEVICLVGVAVERYRGQFLKCARFIELFR